MSRFKIFSYPPPAPSSPAAPSSPSAPFSSRSQTTPPQTRGSLCSPFLFMDRLDERGFTLQTVILTALLALGGVGASIVVFNVASGKTKDVKEVRAQTLDPFYAEQAENPFWVDVEPPTAEEEELIESVRTGEQTLPLAENQITVERFRELVKIYRPDLCREFYPTLCPSDPVDPPPPTTTPTTTTIAELPASFSETITAAGFTATAASLESRFSTLTPTGAQRVVDCIPIFGRIAERSGGFVISDRSNTDIFSSVSWDTATFEANFAEYNSDWSTLTDENKAKYAFLRCMQTRLRSNTNDNQKTNIANAITNLQS